jgi:hypothetical protein
MIIVPLSNFSFDSPATDRRSQLERLVFFFFFFVCSLISWPRRRRSLFALISIMEETAAIQEKRQAQLFCFYFKGDPLH